MSIVFERVKAIQGIVIDPREIIYLVREKMKLHEGALDMTGNMEWNATIFILRKKYHDDYTRIYCIMERMSCLIPILKDERMRGFTYEESDATRLGVRHPVFAAVEKCPLLCDEEHAWFDPEEFMQFVLEHSDTEGRA